MEYSFKAFGHKNILAWHKTTLEFTKGRDISKRADCIIGVNADFDTSKIMKLVRTCSRIRIVIGVDGRKIDISADANPNFNDEREIVVRKTSFSSARTLAVNSGKAAIDIPRSIAEMLKNPGQEIKVSLSSDDAP